MLPKPMRALLLSLTIGRGIFRGRSPPCRSPAPVPVPALALRQRLLSPDQGLADDPPEDAQLATPADTRLRKLGLEITPA